MSSEWDSLTTVRPRPLLARTPHAPRSKESDVAGAREQAETREMANRRAGELGLAPDVTYGLLREGIDLTPSGIAGITEAELAGALTRAVDNGRFTPADPGALARARNRLADLRDGAVAVSDWLGAEGRRQHRKVGSALADLKIDRFARLRSPEGLGALEQIRKQFGPDVHREVAGHVELGLIESDASRRQKLIDAGFTTLDAVVRQPLREFAQAFAPADWVRAVQWQAKAAAARAYAARRVVDARVNGLLRVPPKVSGTAPDPVAEAVTGDDAPCGCADCQAATSPTAYLADLLAYCNDSLTRTGGKLDYAFLARTLHQPFGDLPTSCDAVSAPVRQIRLAIEVLRANLQTAGSRRASAAAERSYLRTAYETLLVRLGTSPIDLRLALTGDATAQQAFAARLGIDNATVPQAGGGTSTKLQRMRIDVDTASLDDIDSRLESTYGLLSTVVDPVTRLRPSAAKPEFLAWRESYLHAQWLAQDWPDDTPGDGIPIIDPDVIGPDDFRTPLAVNPAFALWRGRRDWVEAQLAQLAGIIVAAGSSRLDAWLAAMSATGAPVPYTPGAGVAAVTPTWLDNAAPTPSPEAVLLGRRAELASNDATRIAAATALLRSRFGMTPRAYARLIELYDKEAAALADPRNPALAPAELVEIASILVQSRKQLVFAVWRREERAFEQQTTAASRLEFGPAQFWMSLTEPADGDSPPIDDGRSPWIDPELVAPGDLPDGEVGARASALLTQRRGQIDGVRQMLQNAIAGAAAGARLDAAITACFSNPAIATAGASIQAYVDTTGTLIDSALSTDVDQGQQRLQTVLFIDEDGFRRLRVLVARDRQGDPALKPTAAEVLAAVGILTASRKSRVLYPAWRTEERAAAPNGFAHWEARKVALPAWRGSADARALWHRALSLRSAPAIIDPDLIDDSCLVQFPALVPNPLPATATLADRAAFRARARRTELGTTLTMLRTTREAQAAAPDQGLDALLAVVGLSAAGIEALGNAAATGRAVAPRLRQLDLDYDTFEALRRIARLVNANANVEAAEWDTAYAIALEVWKRRQRARWRDEEKSAGIALDPSAFQIPRPPSGSTGAASAWDALPPWRARLQDRIDWEGRLQGRLDQLAAIATAHEAVLSAVEQTALPGLRDSLIRATATPLGQTAPLAARGTDLGARLLIDLQNSGCAVTTRVAQAIETVQNLIWSLRTGQLRDVHPDWAMTDAALADFDAIWNWLGSYATWRAAIFVLLYPENLTVPSLRRNGSPAFWELVGQLRSVTDISPREAALAHTTYRDYFLDLCELEDSTVRASAVAQSSFYDQERPYANGGWGNTTFLFALTPLARGRRLYWSTFYNDATGRRQQSVWRRLTQFAESIEEVLGASAYTTLSGRPYLYLVVKTSKDQVNHLWFLRFDLQLTGTWDEEATEISLTGATTIPERFEASLLQTTMAETPQIRVQDPANSANLIVLYLDRIGSSGSSTSQSLGIANRWTAPSPLPALPTISYSMHSVDTITFNNAPVTSVEVTVGGMVAASLRDPAQTDLIVAHVVTWLKRPRDINSPETRGLQTFYQVLWNINAQGEPASRSGWIAGPTDSLLRGDDAESCSLAWLPSGGGKLLLFIGGRRDSGATDRLLYWVADGLNSTTGQFANWSAQKDAQFPYTVSRTGLGVAIVPAITGDAEIHLFTSSNGEPADTDTGAPATLAKGILRQNRMRASGDLAAATWSNQREFDLAGTSGTGTAGLALTSARLKGTEIECLVCAWLTDVPGENVGYYQVWDGTQWTTAQTVLESPTGPSAAWFGGDSHGLGVAVADIDADGGPDLLLYHGDILDSDSSTANGYTRVGYRIGIAPRSTQTAAIPRPYKPNYPGSYVTDFGLTPLPSAKLTSVATLNASNTRSNQAAVEEMFYFVPIALGLALQQAGQYVAALDWFRSVYDYSKAETERVLYPGLEHNPGTGIYREPDWAWVRDPLNPHAIAAGRRGVYLRYTLLAVIRCLLDYADAEFTRDTPESLPLARTLYLTALELLESDAIAQNVNGCDALIDQLVFAYGDVEWIPPMVDGVHFGSRNRARQAMADIRNVMAGTDDAAVKATRIGTLIDQATAPERDATIGSALTDAARTYQQAVLAVAADPVFRGEALDLALAVDNGVAFGLSGRVGMPISDLEAQTRITARGLETDSGALLMPWGGGDPVPGGDGGLAPGGIGPGGTGPAIGGPGGFTLDGFGTITIEDLKAFGEKHFGTIPFEGRQPGDDNLDYPFGQVDRRPPDVEVAPPVMSILACVPPNPVLNALRLRADVNLFKLRTCRNIAGMQRGVDAYAAATDTQSGLPVIGADGQLSLPGLTAPPATPFRFGVLLERAKSLVQLAQQVESSMFAAIQQADAERYGSLRARQDIENARAGSQLQILRIGEAQDNQQLVALQQQRGRVVLNYYNGLLNQGMLGEETAALVLEGVVAGMQASAAIGFAAAQQAEAAVSYGIQATESIARILKEMASFERQRQGWQFEAALARQDIQIMNQQYVISEDQIRIANQERVIADLQVQHDQAVVEYLSQKFTNVELYDWMGRVMEGIYKYFLQQATSTAALAMGQMAFERQDTVPPFIQRDYWRSLSEGGATGDAVSSGPNRRGLTGSARLLQDITRLEQFALQTDQRKLQLTKTISMMQIAPLSLQRFREGGVMTFTTPMELFDRDYPGHYLRLIKRVRASIVALTPPGVGIRATLTSGRISRVVVGGDLFQTIRVQRGPEIVALSSPNDSNGLFDLDLQSEMLTPFEGIGVDASWELRMPKAANPFDYDSIADVLLTIDYTALNSFDYQAQLLQTMRPTASAQRAWSFRQELPDQWYQLSNAELSDQPMKVGWTVDAGDFAPNSLSVSTAAVTIYFVRRSGLRLEFPSVDLRFTESGTTGKIGGQTGTVDGIAATSAGNAASWFGMLGRTPIGRWELTLPDTDELRSRFRGGDILDVLFVLGYTAQLPAWPA